MDEVRAWGKDLQVLQTIKGERYRVLIDLYIGEELDLINDWIEKIVDSDKVMETLHAQIYRFKD